MSVENLLKFMQWVKTDEKTAKKAAEIGRGNLAGLIAYGRELKLEFNEKDFEALKTEAQGASKELNEAELGDVSGGTPGWYSPR